MKKWEYDEVLVNDYLSNSLFLNEMGENGWELVTVVPLKENRSITKLRYIFKKEKS